MPFMIGRAPIRRTLKYLESSKLFLREEIQIFSVNYNTHGNEHKGTRELVFWNLPQIQYKNPDVQVITFKNLTPTPFIKCYYEDGKTMLIDTDNKSREEILSHLKVVVGRSSEVLKQDSIKQQRKDNIANFGIGCERNCICIISGQVPCPGLVPLPFHMCGKYKNAKAD